VTVRQSPLRHSELVRRPSCTAHRSGALPVFITRSLNLSDSRQIIARGICRPHDRDRRTLVSTSVRTRKRHAPRLIRATFSASGEVEGAGRRRQISAVISRRAGAPLWNEDEVGSRPPAGRAVEGRYWLNGSGLHLRADLRRGKPNDLFQVTRDPNRLSSDSPRRAATGRRRKEAAGFSNTYARVGIRLAQALQHGKDHRSQVCTTLTTLGIEPPGLRRLRLRGTETVGRGAAAVGQRRCCGVNSTVGVPTEGRIERWAR
jgi:hypothetical protein